MITSFPYYKADILIKDIQDTAPNSSQTGSGSVLDHFIDKCEHDVLIKCLGYALYKEFQSNLELKEGNITYTIKDDADQKWKDLFTGKEYTKDGVPVCWRGIIFKSGDLNRSFIANYVFCEYRKSEYYDPREVDNKTVRMTPEQEYISSYNQFQELVVEGNNGEVSLYQFIRDMNELDANTYSNFSPTDIEKINLFSI